jgi:hypothetical protein
MIWNRQKRVLLIPTLLFLPSIASEVTFNRIGVPDNDMAMILSPDSINHIHVYLRHFRAYNSKANEHHDAIK